MLVGALSINPLAEGYVARYSSPTLHEFQTIHLQDTSFQLNFYGASIYGAELPRHGVAGRSLRSARDADSVDSATVRGLAARPHET